MKPQLTENNHGTGAIVTPTIKNMPTVAGATVPVNWDIGFSIRELVTKNQGQSSSCGGQAVSYKGEADTGIPKSAKFPYSQVYANGGGSGEQGLLKIVVTEGLCDETIVPSYEQGNPPSEYFMENTSTITPLVFMNARVNQSIPEYVDLSFDGIAEAIRDHNGCIGGIYGVNNGTWLTADPKAPTGTPNPSFWAHWVLFGKYRMRNGRRVIGFKNSWGNVGENGWQYITEDYMPYFFSAWTFVKSTGYKFYQNMFFGMNNQDVFALQARLGIKPTGWFGPMTLANVMSYQKAQKITPTGFVGPLTRGSLNTS
jgi:hypothetical protein